MNIECLQDYEADEEALELEEDPGKDGFFDDDYKVEKLTYCILV